MVNIQVRFSNKLTFAPVTQIDIDQAHTIGQLKARVEKELAESEASMMRVFSRWFVERQGEEGKQLVEITAADSGTSVAAFGIEDRAQLYLEGPITDTFEGVGQAPSQFSISMQAQIQNETQQHMLQNESLRNELDAAGITPLKAFWLALQDPQQEASCAYAMSLIKDLADGIETRSDAADGLDPDLLGLTPLLLATKANRADVAIALIFAGADAMTTYNSALHIATTLGHTTLVERLVDAGIDVNHFDSNNQTALHIAAENGHVAAIEALVAKGANIEAIDPFELTPLHFAAYNGHVAAIEILAAMGANFEAYDQHGYTPLHIAARKCHIAAIEALAAKGANVNVGDNNGCTPLYDAAYYGQVVTIETLAAKGANIDATKKDGYTPLYAAAQNGHVAAIEALVEKAANIEARNVHGAAPLHAAAYYGHVDAIETLIAKGANVNAVTKDGRTPLYSAAQNGHVDAIEALVAKGADVNVTTKDGETPLEALLSFLTSYPRLSEAEKVRIVAVLTPKG